MFVTYHTCKLFDFSSHFICRDIETCVAELVSLYKD